MRAREINSKKEKYVRARSRAFFASDKYRRKADRERFHTA